MQKIISITLQRDCPAVQIPAGTQVTLPAGTAIDLTQTLGGSFTVHAPGGLFRIDAADADALGQTVSPSASENQSSEGGALNEETVWNALRTCYDPEIPVNIVDLGLVYDLKIERRSDGTNGIDVKMTLTAPGCGMGGVIAGDAQQKLLKLPGVDEAVVEIVWEPQWHHSMISEAGRKTLGLD